MSLTTFAFSLVAQTNKMKVAPGYKISWELSIGYPFDINIIQLKPDFIFDWSMGDENKGKVTVTNEGLTGAKKLINDFNNGETIIYTKATTVIISEAIFKNLKAGKSVTINSNDTIQKLTFVNKEKMNVLVDGKEVPFDVLYAETDINHKYWIWDNAETPFILKMDLGWVLQIKSIITKK